VGAVLGDALRRVCALGGREGMPRSLGSLYGGSVTRFLGGGLRGVVSRVIDMPVCAFYSSIAVTRDGSTLLASDTASGTSAIHANVSDGAALPLITRGGTEPQLEPGEMCVASDGFVFTAAAAACRC
jgi:hypothetical protein